MENPVRFRIGFEFQMHGQLCEWALPQKFQKKEMFSSIKSEKLWHVELDGTDIEFVTEPFEEKEKISSCITDINRSVDILMELLNNDTLQISISAWFESCVSRGISLVQTQPFFNEVASFFLKKMSSAWQPKWQPQVTIQHPLKATVNLCYELFHKCRPNLCRETLPFFMTMAEDAPKYNTAIGGLIFLQAHQIAGMTKSNMLSMQERIAMLASGWNISSLSDDSRLMAGTLFDYRTYHQFDAKRRTAFMSRRPFSHMLYEIKNTNPEMSSLTDSFSVESSRQKNYLDLFSDAMKDTDPFLKLKVEDNYYKANYAEQFYDENSEPVDLTELYDYFDEPTKQASVILGNENCCIIRELLKVGLLSTTMLRHLNLESLVDCGIMTRETSQEIQRIYSKDYYPTALSSVESNDLERRFLKIEKNDHLRIMLAPPLGLPHKIDQLSPPFPLDMYDSIGRYRDGDLRVQEFGSAIVEFRCIEYLKDLYDSEHSGTNEFLMEPRFVLNEAITLFDKVTSILTPKRK